MQKIAIFGAGNCGRLIAAKLLASGDEILCFVDNDKNKVGKMIEISPNFADNGGGGGRTALKQTQICSQIPILSSEKLLEMSVDKIIIGTFTGFYEIAAQCENLGFTRDKIDTSHIELSVRARENFLSDFAKENANLDGAVAELGVYRGDFARKINEAFANKRLYLFDTFEGFSSVDLKNEKDGKMGANVGEKHFANTSVDLVLSKMLKPENCVIKKGWFPQSADGVDERFCFVNLDADLYEPILAGLRFFYPKMTRGGVILIHEYFSNGYVGVRKAVCEFFAEFNLNAWQKLPIGDNLSIAVVKI